jgi:hypothetical protein
MVTSDTSSLFQGSEDAATSASASDVERYRGIGRLSFAIILSLMIALTIASGRWLESSNISLDFSVRAWIFLVVIALVGVLPRALNMGMHPAKVLLTFVPIANLILGLRCLVYQEGYEATKKVDKVGKVIATIIGIIFLIGYILIFRAELHAAY